MPLTLPDTTGTDLIAAVAAMSKEERRDRLDRALRAIAAAEGEVLALVGEVERNQDYRDDGATSTEAWLAERYGVSASRARAYVHVGEKAPNSRTWWGRCVPVRCPSTRCGWWPTWRPLGPSAGCARRPRSARSVSWPTSPARPGNWPGPRRRLRGALNTTGASCASTTSTGPCRCSCPATRTPRPGLGSRRRPKRSLQTARRRGTSVAPTP